MTVLRQASWLWLIIAVVTSGLTYWVAAITQFVAGNAIGKMSDLLLLQFAGSFMNHFLPFSLGSVGMTTDYYRKHGQRQSQAIIIATIPIIFGVITTILIIAITSPVTLVQLGHSLRDNPRIRLLTMILGGCIVLALLALPLYKRQFNNALKQTAIGLRDIRSFGRAAKVIAGSTAITLVSALTLYTSVKAIDAHITLVAVITLYISSSLVSNLAPTPGGLGATEAVLIFGFLRAGLNPSQALASTLIFRFVTFWLPMLPGGIALRQLNQRSAIGLNVNRH